MTGIVLNTRTKNKLTVLHTQLPHALLLAGESGVGLATIARSLADKHLSAFIEPVDSKGNPSHDTGSISVAVIRELYEQTRTKSEVPRVFIIDDADRMSLGAEAAFLKLLEEPTKNTHFILTSHSPEVLLPTVRSRLQTVIVESISDSQTATLIDQLGVRDATAQTQLIYLASGLPAELTRLVQDQAHFKQRAATMADTRTFLTGTPYQRLLVIQAYYQNKAQALELLDSALAVSKRSFTAKPQKDLAKQLEKLLRAREKIEANCNTRLQLMTLVV